MQADKPAARTQRLALIFRSAGSLWALPASAVLEVAPPPGSEGAREVRGLPIEDFAQLLGQGQSGGAGAVTLVLDCAPPRALLVDAVEEVVDFAAAPFFQLPAAVRAPTGALIRGALLRGERLVLEIDPQLLGELLPGAAPAWRPSLREGQGCSEPPARALVYEIGEGTLAGTALSLVTGVLRVERLCRVPRAPLGHLGMLHHERTLLSLYDLSHIAGGPPTAGEYAVAMDVGGSAVAVAARRVIGVLDGFTGAAGPCLGGVCHEARDGRKVFFPELELLLPAAG